MYTETGTFSIEENTLTGTLSLIENVIYFNVLNYSDDDSYPSDYDEHYAYGIYELSSNTFRFGENYNYPIGSTEEWIVCDGDGVWDYYYYEYVRVE